MKFVLRLRGLPDPSSGEFVEGRFALKKPRWVWAESSAGLSAEEA